MNLIRTRIALMIAATALAGSTAMAQPLQQPPQEHQRAKTPEPVTGELLSLNTETKTLVVKTTADTEVKFTFTDATEILGADKGVSGLATTQGATVTVHYDTHGTANVATKIEVKPKQQ
jgi:hypothetical protein